MTAPLSIVIPTRNAASALPGILARCVEARSSGLCAEIIVSDGGSEDDTRALATAAHATVLKSAIGRGTQLRAGAAQVATPWMLAVHADTDLGAGWQDAVRTHIHEFPDRAGYFRLRFRASGLAPALVAGGANLRSRLCGLPYGDQGLLIPMQLYRAVGGYPDQPLMEDVEMARRLSGRLRELPADAHTAPDRYRRNGWMRQLCGNLLRLTRYTLGTPAAKLAREYRNR